MWRFNVCNTIYIQFRDNVAQHLIMMLDKLKHRFILILVNNITT